MSTLSRVAAASAVSLVAVVAAGGAEAQGFRDDRRGGFTFSRFDRPSGLTRRIDVEPGRGSFSPQVPARPRISPQVQVQPRISPQQPARPRISPQVQPGQIFSSPQAAPRPSFSPQVPAAPRVSPQIPVQQAGRPSGPPQVSAPRFNPAVPLAAAAVTGSVAIASSNAASARPAAPVDRPRPAERTQGVDPGDLSDASLSVLDPSRVPDQPQVAEEPQLAESSATEPRPLADAAQAEAQSIAEAPVETAKVARARIVGLYRDADGQLQYLRDGDAENRAAATEIWDRRGSSGGYRPAHAGHRPAYAVYGHRSGYGRTAYSYGGNHCQR